MTGLQAAGGLLSQGEAEYNRALMTAKEDLDLVIVGGLWRDLPPWQDIQFRKEDWTLGDLPLSGEDQRRNS